MGGGGGGGGGGALLPPIPFLTLHTDDYHLAT